MFKRNNAVVDLVSLGLCALNGSYSCLGLEQSLVFMQISCQSANTIGIEVSDKVSGHGKAQPRSRKLNLPPAWFESNAATPVTILMRQMSGVRT